MIDVYVLVCTTCNIKCKYCWYVQGVNSRLPQRLKPDNLAQWLESAALSVRTLTYTGGEPYMRKDFDAFLDLAAQHHFKTTVITNGTLLNESRVSKLRDYQVSVHLSLDGLGKYHEEMRGKLAETMRAAHLLTAYDIPNRLITVVLTRGNLQEIEPLRHFSRDHGFEVKFQPADLPAEDPLSLANCSDTELETMMRSLIPWAEESHCTDYLGLIVKWLRDDILFVPTCPFAHSSLVIDAVGEIYPCFQTQGNSLGNIAETTLDQAANKRVDFLHHLQPARCFQTGCLGVFH